MQSKTLKRRREKRRSKMKTTTTLARHLQVQLGQVSLFPLHHHQSPASTSSSSLSNNPNPSSSLFQNLLGSDSSDLQSSSLAMDADSNADDRDFILSQDFFCTPDYITPDNQHLLNGLDCNKENLPCPKSPEKLNTVKSKRLRQDDMSEIPVSTLSGHQQIVELAMDTNDDENVKIENTTVTGVQKSKNCVSQSVVALRYQVMPPPCIRNPYLSCPTAELDMDALGNQRSKCAGFFPTFIGGDGLSRYHTDFHQIKQIGTGNFSRVFKVLKRIDGCLYAVKQSTRQLHLDRERKKALMEVQALAALESHQNIVGYYSSWFENEQLYIQMELCNNSLSSNKSSRLLTEREVLEALHQIAKALLFIHERGIAHLDVKPDNIYVKNGVYKLGDFGCATLLDKSLPIEEGDARYMPQEILNDKYDHLDKVDIFSLGIAVYELIRGSPLPESGPQFLNLREGKLPLLPGHSLQFQNLLKVMVDPDPVRRPSAKELVENPIFDKVQGNSKT